MIEPVVSSRGLSGAPRLRDVVAWAAQADPDDVTVALDRASILLRLKTREEEHVVALREVRRAACYLLARMADADRVSSPFGRSNHAMSVIREAAKVGDLVAALEAWDEGESWKSLGDHLRHWRKPRCSDKVWCERCQTSTWRRARDVQDAANERAAAEWDADRAAAHAHEEEVRERTRELADLDDQIYERKQELVSGHLANADLDESKEESHSQMAQREALDVMRKAMHSRNGAPIGGRAASSAAAVRAAITRLRWDVGLPIGIVNGRAVHLRTLGDYRHLAAGQRENLARITARAASIEGVIAMCEQQGLSDDDAVPPRMWPTFDEATFREFLNGGAA